MWDFLPGEAGEDGEGEGYCWVELEILVVLGEATCWGAVEEGASWANWGGKERWRVRSRVVRYVAVGVLRHLKRIRMG
jgi:hypothetical protein